MNLPHADKLLTFVLSRKYADMALVQSLRPTVLGDPRPHIVGYSVLANCAI